MFLGAFGMPIGKLIRYEPTSLGVLLTVPFR